MVSNYKHPLHLLFDRFGKLETSAWHGEMERGYGQIYITLLIPVRTYNVFGAGLIAVVKNKERNLESVTYISAEEIITVTTQRTQLTCE